MGPSRHGSIASLLAVTLISVALALVIAGCGAPPAEPADSAGEAAAPTGEAVEEATEAAAPTAEPTPEPTSPPPTDEPPTPTPVPPTDTPTPAPASSANYELVFYATWSEETHPSNFPPNPHFSPLIGATHGADAAMWAEGQLSSPGMKNMAETGGTSPLDAEIEALIAEGSACTLIEGGPVPVSPGRQSVAFTVSLDCPLVSVVTMIAPSPDWFVGVSGLSLLENGAWVDDLEIVLLPYDAGTDSGPAYTSANDPTTDPQPIYLIDGEPFLVDGSVVPLGSFRFIRMDE